MIQGFHLKVTSAEIRAHCLARASYHRDRARVKRQELPKLKEAMEHIKAATFLPSSVTTMNKGGYNHNPNEAVENLESDIRDHDNKSLVFDYFAAHLFDEDYDLAEADLRRLEILK